MSHGYSRKGTPEYEIEEYHSPVGSIACLDGLIEDDPVLDEEIMGLYYMGYDLDDVVIINGGVYAD
jgi:hypothetical protein